MKRTVTVPDALVLVWIVAAGVGMALAAAAAMEPPSYDPMSYVVKAHGFWDAITNGRMVNPFGLGPSVRPPGTILVSYPFGFSPDFRWFYFRTCFIPLLMLAAAVYIAGYKRDQSAPERWMLAALAVTLGGLPTLYQFQYNEPMPAASFWGLVDNFIAGASAIGMAAALRSVREQSWRWALVAALGGALALMIKPAGLLVMAVIGMAWMILIASARGWRFAKLRADAAGYAFAVKGLTAAVIVYVLVVLSAFATHYFSPSNIAFGSQVLKVMNSTILSTLDADMVILMIRISFGFAIPFVIAVGFGAGLAAPAARGAVLAALLCFVTGVWFWIVETDVALARYALPFAAMTFVALVPPLLMMAARTRQRAVVAGGALAAALPTLIIAVMMFTPDASLRVQKALGVNLAANLFQAESDQALALMAKMKADGELKAPVYLFHTTSALRNFAAGLMYPSFLEPAGPQPSLRLPMDWQRSTTFRIGELATSRYIAFEPVADEAKRQAIVARGAKDFAEEYELISAVFTDLTDADGLCTVSETRVRVLEVCRPEAFEATLARLKQAHNWTPAFREANAD
ncbi:MAG: hypothetical protein K2P94_10640 [Rhodospirillaceae bacterium]|nr:hypothetical protein [Rhodospirillaceae bacterium]